MSRIIFRKENKTFEQAVERTHKEYIKERIEYEKPKKMTDKVYFSGIVRVLYEDKIITYCADEEDESQTSFENILKKLNVNYTKGVIYLWIERCLEGEIWQYGNYPNSNKWYFHAKTKGYA